MAKTLDDMSGRYVTEEMKKAGEKITHCIVSSDSHVDEPSDLWKELPREFQDDLPVPPAYSPGERPTGGLDPTARIADMKLDGVTCEILYPTATLRAYHRPQTVQEAAFRLYNDWVADYCKIAPNQFYAVPCLSAYDIDVAIKEMHRCADMGLLGGLVWQVPPPDLPLYSDHYEKLWAAAAELGKPIHFHILTGFNYFRFKRGGLDKVRGSVNSKTCEIYNTVYDMIFSGVFERHPKLKVVIVEGEIGWAPFILQQWDYYYLRNTKPGRPNTDFAIKRLPSEIFEEHIYLTFMDDAVGCQTLGLWGQKNCMWSSDYPHSNMTWPNSRAFIARQLGNLDNEVKKRVLAQNCIDLYGLDIKP